MNNSESEQLTFPLITGSVKFCGKSGSVRANKLCYVIGSGLFPSLLVSYNTHSHTRPSIKMTRLLSFTSFILRRTALTFCSAQYFVSSLFPLRPSTATSRSSSPCTFRRLEGRTTGLTWAMRKTSFGRTNVLLIIRTAQWTHAPLSANFKKRLLLPSDNRFYFSTIHESARSSFWLIIWFSGLVIDKNTTNF